MTEFELAEANVVTTAYRFKEARQDLDLHPQPFDSNRYKILLGRIAMFQSDLFTALEYLDRIREKDRAKLLSTLGRPLAEVLKETGLLDDPLASTPDADPKLETFS